MADSLNSNGKEGEPDGRVGLVSTAVTAEANQDEFYFWVDKTRLVEATQLVRVTLPLPADDPRVQKLIVPEAVVIAAVEQVKRQSESATVGSDHGRYNGKANEKPLLPPAGFTYAHCQVIQIEPQIFVPLIEGLPVYLATETEAGQGYGYPEMEAEEAAVTVGLLQNGGSEVAGPAKLDSRFILGEYGGHVNVTGVAGTATKTSFLLVLVKMLLIHARNYSADHQDAPLHITPIVFNVKGSDLMWLNQSSKRFDPQADEWKPYRDAWEPDLFDQFATPFAGARFFSYMDRDGQLKPSVPPNTTPYSWGLGDVIEWGAQKYLFSAETRSQELIAGVLEDAFDFISEKDPTSSSGRRLKAKNSAGIKCFRDLVEWVMAGAAKASKGDEDEEEPEDNGQPAEASANGESAPDSEQPAAEVQVEAPQQGESKSNGKKKGKDRHFLIRRQHDPSSIRAAARRLNIILTEGRGVLEIEGEHGAPPDITTDSSTDPLVVDIEGMSDALQRFVVAAVLERIKRHRAKHADRRQRYIVVLDELNRFAPRGSSDEITKLFEHVAAQLRSQGILLFGAQQKASAVSPLVWENAATKVLGRAGPVELASDMWRHLLNETQRKRAEKLQKHEKIILQDAFPYPMLAKIPLTPWATRKDEAGTPEAAVGKTDETGSPAAESAIEQLDWGVPS